MKWEDLKTLLAEHGLPQRILDALNKKDAEYWEGFHDGLHGWLLAPPLPPAEPDQSAVEPVAPAFLGEGLPSTDD